MKFNKTYCDDVDEFAQSTYDTVVGLPRELLWIQLIFFYIIICGISASLCSILVCCTILKSSLLRTRFFIIVGCLTFCRLGISLQFLVIGVFRSLRTEHRVSLCQKRIVCHLLHFWLFVGWTVEMFLLFLLVVDRAIALTNPFFYRRLTPRSAFYACVLIFAVVGVLKLVPSYVGVDFDGRYPCVNVYSAPSAIYGVASQIIDAVMAGMILLVYCITIMCVRRKLIRLRRTSDNSVASRAAIQTHMDVMPVLRNLVMLHCLLSLAAKLCLLLGSIETLSYNKLWTAVGGMISSGDAFVNVFVLVTNNEEIRKACVLCFRNSSRLRSNQVSDIPRQSSRISIITN